MAISQIEMTIGVIIHLVFELCKTVNSNVYAFQSRSFLYSHFLYIHEALITNRDPPQSPKAREVQSRNGLIIHCIARNRNLRHSPV